MFVFFTILCECADNYILCRQFINVLHFSFICSELESYVYMSVTGAVGDDPCLTPQVRSVIWSMDDSRLVSCGQDGAVYEWNTLSSKRESESVLKTCSYTSVAMSSDGKIFFAVGTDRTLKEIQDCQVFYRIWNLNIL